MTTEPITIATATDDGYALPCAVMLRSLGAHLPADVFVNVFVLSCGLTRNTLRLIENACRGSHITLKHVTVASANVSDLKISHHISISTYYRLLLEDLLPEVSKVLYLDADLVIRASITDLWDIPLGTALLGAVRHASKLSATFAAPRGIPSFAKLGLPGHLPTFNAGVMIIDLDKWRAANVSQRTLDYLRNFRDYVLWWDQDGLNVILHGQWRQLPAHWNVMSSHFATFSQWQDSVLSQSEYERALRAPSIIHFSSEDKPWRQGYLGPFLEHSQEYAAQCEP